MLHEHRVLTTHQIARLAYTSLRSAQRRLRTLHQHAVLDSFRPLTATGSAPEHYTLGPTGAALLAAHAGLDTSALGWRPTHTGHIAYSPSLGHDLGVNDLLTHLAAHAHTTPNTGLPLWLSERSAARCWGDLIRPDAYAHYRDGDPVLPFFLEYDTGSQPLARVEAKLVGYAAFTSATNTRPALLIHTRTQSRDQALRYRLADPARDLKLNVATSSADFTTTAPWGPWWTPLQPGAPPRCPRRSRRSMDGTKPGFRPGPDRRRHHPHRPRAPTSSYASEGRIVSSLLTKAVGGIGCVVLALPVLAALTIAAAFGGASANNTASAVPSRQAINDIPPRMLALYQSAALACTGLSWTVLAAIGKIETDHARHPTMVSTAGAVGPMQFLPSTFQTYAHPVPPGGKNPPTPWDPADAVYAAARMLCANGARGGKNLQVAVFAYNHSHSYVSEVLTTARRYGAVTSLPTTAAAKAVAFTRAQLGTPYIWGGNGPSDGGFDCSGLTQAAYRAAGIPLPRVVQAQYNADPRLPKGTQLIPGDLLFYGTSPRHITHVALYTGGGEAIDAPHPGAVVRQGPARTHTPAFQGATRPATRGGGGPR
ncbi:replication-relaxation family protein [Streptomyces yunnanensis]|uniref:Cell wall-associated hydrolase, NlpC family n=1 Tax=Streptomyces yunnanensis TaxID=156453 RepID=A0A9X8QSP8_9ACTN|nr:replication-relaxation family protein [Streptomyces yunnanensis]SHL81380.1 Cell wall-associated hydrolase, NlpC family [Streptomyces yunnanensis]